MSLVSALQSYLDAVRNVWPTHPESLLHPVRLAHKVACALSGRAGLKEPPPVEESGFLRTEDIPVAWGADPTKWRRWQQEVEDLIAVARAVEGPADTIQGAASPASGEAEDSMLDPVGLAERFARSPGAVQKALGRWRELNPQDRGRGWVEVQYPRTRQPHYLYRLGTVRPVVEAVKAVQHTSIEKKSRRKSR